MTTSTLNQDSASVASPVNLFGDRHIEWSWTAAHVPDGPGEALEFGPGDSWLSLVAIHRGYRVTTVDLVQTEHPYVEPKLKPLYGSLLDIDLPENHYDLVMNCSAVEHVGLAGRYGVTEDDADGDLRVMEKLRSLMKPSATMSLTIPVGRDAVFAPMCRVYGENRLPLLLRGFGVQTEAYWIKDDQNRWTRCAKEAALDYEASAGDEDWRKNIYGLGCYVLNRA